MLGVEEVEVRPHERLQNVFWVKLDDGVERLATRSLASGSVYGERIVAFEGVEYRVWDPYRSKLAAAILRKTKFVPIKPEAKVLYLGAASGTTVSHVSDIVGEKGLVYCVEFAARVMRELVNHVCSCRVNTIPILADARFPGRYRSAVAAVDSIYCDIAQPEQAKILADNAEVYLKHGEGVMLAVKARSIDVTEEPSKVFRREVDLLRKFGFKVHEVVRLDPFEKDHVMVTATYRSG